MNEKMFTRKIAKLLDSLPENIRSSMHPKINDLVERGVDSFDSLLGIIENPNTEIATTISALWLTGRLGNKKATNSLMKAFDRQDAGIMWESAIAIGLVKSKSAVAPLSAELTSGNDSSKRAAAAYALGLIDDKRAEPSLLEIMGRTVESSLVKSHAAEALGRLRSKKGRRVLVKALTDASEDVVYSSVYALGQIGGKESIADLRDFLQTSPKTFERAREEAARILHDLKG